jgi:fatty acid-binding protein DegV
VENGKTSVLAKVRTNKKAVLAMVDRMMKDVSQYGLGEIVIHHINCLQKAKELAVQVSIMSC